MNRSLYKNFAKYVSLNVLGMIGLSCYILADTFFVSKALGALGIAALNFSISIYSVIHGIGLMVGIGGATRYSILKSQGKDQDADVVFTHSVLFGTALGVILLLIGIFGSKWLAVALGADSLTLPMTKTYLTTILMFSPAFIMNNIMLAFVRNDYNPKLSMGAMLIGSFSNVILDYIFMFPLNTGMFGAAFATCLAPIISILVLVRHFAVQKNGFRLTKTKVFAFIFGDITMLGLSSFVNEISSAITLMIFNLIIFSLEGNLGVAAYGIVANLSLIGIAIFTGLAQGIQPLLSKAHGQKDHKLTKSVLKLALITSFVLGLGIYASVFLGADGIIRFFNSEQNLQIATLADTGLKIYFIGFFFAGLNITLAQYLSSIEKTKLAFAISLLRGCVLIVPFVLILSRLFSMTGVWTSFVLTEVVVVVFSVLVLSSAKQKEALDIVSSFEEAA